MKRRTCPRTLTHHERDAELKTCAVCRGVRVPTSGKPIVVAAPKPTTPEAKKAGESWWTSLTSEELNAESRQRFTR